MTDHPDIVERRAELGDDWPIVQISVNEKGEIEHARFYTPGLPPGQHDLWCVSVEATVLLSEQDAEITRLRAEVEKVANEYADACHLVAQMHHAATGYVTGPKLGVVEDVAAVRAEAETLRKALLAIVDRDFTFFDGYVDRYTITYGEIQQARAAIAATKEQQA